MKTATIVKELKRAGATVLSPNADEHRYRYEASMGDRWASWNDSNGETSLIRCGYAGQHDDLLTDYFAGSYVQRLKSVVAHLKGKTR